MGAMVVAFQGASACGPARELELKDKRQCQAGSLMTPRVNGLSVMPTVSGA
jgi:hypothetical protein